MIRALALLPALLATQADALSCLRMEPGDAYDAAAASTSQYTVVSGMVAFDSSLLPRNRYPKTENPPPHNEIAARIKGQALDTNGFLAPFDSSVTLDVLCLGPWCGALDGGTRYLMFLERKGDDYILGLGPCGGTAFADPSPETLAHVASCFQTRRRCGNGPRP